MCGGREGSFRQSIFLDDLRVRGSSSARSPHLLDPHFPRGLCLCDTLGQASHKPSITQHSKIRVIRWLCSMLLWFRRLCVMLRGQQPGQAFSMSSMKLPNIFPASFSPSRLQQSCLPPPRSQGSAQSPPTSWTATLGSKATLDPLLAEKQCLNSKAAGIFQEFWPAPTPPRLMCPHLLKHAMLRGHRGEARMSSVTSCCVSH